MANATIINIEMRNKTEKYGPICGKTLMDTLGLQSWL
jgi:hypothetical protein